MARLEVIFGNPESETVSLFYDLKDLPVTGRWMSALEHNLARGARINDRFVGFGRTPELVEGELRQAVAVVQEHSWDAIPFELPRPLDKETMNRLHRCFEDMIGSVESITPFYHGSPEHVKKAISDVNQRLHELEALAPWLPNHRCDPHLYVELLGIDRFLLQPEDYAHFSLKLGFGDIYLHYAQLGKQILDVFNDNDTHVSDENVRPLKYVSGEFDLHFFETGVPWYKDRFFNWLRERGMDPQDPSLALGWLVIGRLDRDSPAIRGMSEEQIVELISRYAKVHQAKLHR